MSHRLCDPGKVLAVTVGGKEKNRQMRTLKAEILEGNLTEVHW